MPGVNPFNHQICFAYPSRVGTRAGESFPVSGWIGHVPFGMYLVDLLRPKALAELGTGYGASYCAFCQAVKELRLGTRCYGIDSWQGDAQSASYGPEVLADLAEHHNPLYGSFSRLIQSTFDEALNSFPDDTFDLLHIDGPHTYESVKADFEKWLPKMTDRGIVLFHGINVREGDSGVWKFWTELKHQYPSFEFLHAQGLGVLAIGNDYPEELNTLLHCSEAEAMKVRRFFSSLGARLEAVQASQSVNSALETLKAQMQTTNAGIQEATQQISVLNAQLVERDGRLSDLDARLQESEAQLQQRVAQLQGESDAQLQERDMQLQESDTRLRERDEQLRERDEQLRERDEQLRERDAQLRERDAQLPERDALIREKEAELIALQARMEDLTRQQGELQGRADEQDLLIRDKDSQLRSALNQAEENQLALQKQAQQISELKQDLTDRDVKAAENHLALQKQAQQISKLKQDLTDKDVKAAESHLALQAQAHLISELKQDVTERDVKLQSAQLLIRSWERRTQELGHLLAGIQDVRRTGSYRLVRALSSPLRAGKKYQKRLTRFLRRVGGPRAAQRPGLKSQKEENLPRIAVSTNTQIGETEAIESTLSEAHEKALTATACLLQNLWLCNNVSTKETALFDAEWYLLENPDVAHANADPLVHYLNWGSNEGRAPHPLFDPKFYLTTYPDAAMGGGANALKHYLTQGWMKGYRPHPKFDPTFYLTMYPDVEKAGIEPLTHFVTNGLREGRCASAEDIHIEPFEADFTISREPTSDAPPVESDVKAIAFFLPQFHPIPENDEWWGTGFTEWTNVRRGEPQYKDHYQPHVPSVLGYYDLRETTVLERQVALAREYGIYGFCFYYYWFVGKILLDLPIRRMLETGKPDFPFCICWANENWTRRWDGQDSEILIGQQHSPEDDLAFLHNIEPILLHKNYIRVEGKPLLIVYQPSFLPDAQATAARWREAFRARGHGEIFLAATQTFAHQTPPQQYGFDAVIQFPPHANCAPITGLTEGLNRSFSGHIYDYNQTKWSFIDELYQLSPSRRIYPGVMPSWDNTARRRTKSNVWFNSSPESYYDWLWQVTSFLRKTRPNDEKLVFINAWNEWAEGCHLEPDQNFGHGWLNATRLALQSEGTFIDDDADS